MVERYFLAERLSYHISDGSGARFPGIEQALARAGKRLCEQGALGAGSGAVNTFYYNKLLPNLIVTEQGSAFYIYLGIWYFAPIVNIRLMEHNTKTMLSIGKAEAERA